jgi:hypothetical protein
LRDRRTIACPPYDLPRTVARGFFDGRVATTVYALGRACEKIPGTSAFTLNGALINMGLQMLEGRACAKEPAHEAVESKYVVPWNGRISAAKPKSIFGSGRFRSLLRDWRVIAVSNISRLDPSPGYASA